MVELKEIAEKLIGGKADEVHSLVKRALDEGQDVSKILNEGLVAGMSVVGDKFKKNEFYVPEVLIAARAMKAGMGLIRPILMERNIKGLGTVLLGTVRGDLHDIGKNLVGMMLEGAGFEVIDLGVDVSSEKFIQVAKEKDANLVGLSALLTTTMLSMKDVVGAVQKEGLKGKVKVIIGGAPVTQDYANEIGADGYAPDAASAADKAKELLKS
ncbi:cobalamin-binding protein [Candidatus Aerophobetes bacterium]|uniref:Cobalamin-binding protein n=1 Tax=Aerophobetes bacterium TaxID=2030807 RepID=A0A523UW51_UNCAE|nr:MAG: cobalamin-binding protein [Candidatus Aerophobetes bacterium]